MIRPAGGAGCRPRLRGLRALLPLAAYIWLLPGQARAQENAVSTNLSLLKRLSYEALGDILDSLRVEPGRRVYVQPADYHETNWLVGETLAKLLHERNVDAVLLDQSTAAAPAVATPDTQEVGDEETEDADAAGEAGDGSPPPVGGTVGVKPMEVEKDKGEGEEGTEEDATEEGADGSAEEPFDEDGQADPFNEEDELEEGSETGDGEGEEETVEEPADARSRRHVRNPAGAEPARAKAPPPRPVVARADVTGDVLRFRVLELGVTYPSSKRSLIFFGPSSITRLGGANFRVTLVKEPEGSVQGVADSERHRIDSFPGRMRPYVEGPDYPFSRPMTNPAPWGRLVEPAVVLGIVSGLVYLFYANQS